MSVERFRRSTGNSRRRCKIYRDTTRIAGEKCFEKYYVIIVNIKKKTKKHKTAGDSKWFFRIVFISVTSKIRTLIKRHSMSTRPSEIFRGFTNRFCPVIIVSNDPSNIIVFKYFLQETGEILTQCVTATGYVFPPGTCAKRWPTHSPTKPGRPWGL